MKHYTLLHNPRCSKSRQALSILHASSMPYTVHEYLKTPLDKAQVEALFKQIDCDHPRAMLRTKEAEYRLAQLDENSTADDVFSAIATYPKLLERPILSDGEHAVIGRPPENIEALLHA